MSRFRIDGLALVAIFFIGFLGFNLVRDAFASDGGNLTSSQSASSLQSSVGGPQNELQANLAAGEAVAPVQPGSDGVAYVIQDMLTPPAPGASPTSAPSGMNADLSDVTGDPDAIVFPYADFIVTQGVHGAEYGQMAVDIAAGKGAAVNSPINGKVTALYVDEYGNPVLVLENTRWAIMLYHGQFSAKVGDIVPIGSSVGLESNQGYTVDGFGQLCAGRDCGYHSHINVYDKQLGSNVNPLEILKPLTP